MWVFVMVVFVCGLVFVGFFNFEVIEVIIIMFLDDDCKG